VPTLANPHGNVIGLISAFRARGREQRPSLRKLSSVQVREILSTPLPLKRGAIAEMARRYGLHKDSIRRILSGRCYKELWRQTDTSPSGAP
jgi:ActR/RegA family two-component response regulator